MWTRDDGSVVYQFSFDCDTIITGSPVSGDLGINGSVSGVTTIEIEDSPLFWSVDLKSSNNIE